MRHMLLIAMGVVAALATTAHAYPQFQLNGESTCTGCHIAPDGGGLLNENGLAVAEAIAWRSGDSAFLHGALDTPSWLVLGGDARFAGGFVDNGKAGGAAYPMQAELQAAATKSGFTLYVSGGLRRPEDGASPAHVFWSREHFVMWQQHPGGTEGVYVRAGRFEPTFGLRLAEHIVYTQRYGGYPLYGDAYGVQASYVSHAFEVHATGFIHDPIATEVEHGDGGAVYAEVRIGDHAALGAEGKYSNSEDQTRMYGGMTGKLYLPGPKLMLLGEGQVIRQQITASPDTDRATQIAAYVLASRSFDKGIMVDAGAGTFTQDTRVRHLDRDCVDVNVHWFQSSHLEWLLTTRLELLARGAGPNGGYVLAQIHYRL